MYTDIDPPEERDLTPKQILLMGEQRYLQKRFARAIKLASIAAHIDLQQGDALVTLLDMHTAGIEPSAGKIAHRLYVEPQTCTYLLNKLEEKGYIKREKDLGGNFSKVYVHLTEEGEAKAKDLSRAYWGTYQTLWPLFLESVQQITALIEEAQQEY